MYSKCPHCSTIFRVHADQLTAAHGQVRCGECGGLFNALQTLMDRLPEEFEEPAGESVAGASAPPRPVAPDQGGEDGEWLAEASIDPAPGSPAWEVEEIEPPAAEETLDEPQVEGIEVTWHQLPPSAAAAAAQPGEAGLEFNLPPEQWSRVFGEARSEPPGQAATSGTPVGGEEDLEPDLEFFEEMAERTGRRSLWGVGSLVLGLLLAGQLLYHYRQPLLADSSTAAYAERAYRLFGLEPPLILDLTEYSLAQRRATGTAGAGTLTIVATLRNDAARSQPYPLLRVVLKDRWGEEVGVRLFEPAEYLPPAASSVGRLGPGQTADARLGIVDPGSAADGFDLELCTRDAQDRLACEG